MATFLAFPGDNVSFNSQMEPWNDIYNYQGNTMGVGIVFQGYSFTFKVTTFQMIKKVSIHKLQLWNDTQSFEEHKSGALLFFKVIRLISRSRGPRNRQFGTDFVVSGWYHDSSFNSQMAMEWSTKLRKAYLWVFKVICLILISNWPNSMSLTAIKSIRLALMLAYIYNKMY